MPAAAKVAVVDGSRVRLTPHTRPRAHSPRAALTQARWVATSEAEQAVSTLREGPYRASISIYINQSINQSIKQASNQSISSETIIIRQISRSIVLFGLRRPSFVVSEI
eukprot:7011041-Pyramimonas_sp.AAC.2